MDHGMMDRPLPACRDASLRPFLRWQHSTLQGPYWPPHGLTTGKRAAGSLPAHPTLFR